MVDVNLVYSTVNVELNKEQSGNTLSPTEFNSIISVVNTEYFTQKYGLPADYTPGRPIPAIAMDITQKIIDDMKSLRVSLGGKNRPALSIDVNGWADYPSDYVHVSSIATLDGRQVEVLRDDFIANRLDNSIKFPTAKNPICSLQDDFIEFYPKDLGFVKFNYLRLPQTPIWGYTISDDVPVYNSATSTNFEWPTDCTGDIVALVLNYAAKNLRDPLMIPQSEQRKEKGI